MCCDKDKSDQAAGLPDGIESSDGGGFYVVGLKKLQGLKIGDVTIIVTKVKGNSARLVVRADRSKKIEKITVTPEEITKRSKKS